MSTRSAVAAALGVVTLAVSGCSSSSNSSPSGSTVGHSRSPGTIAVSSTLDGHATLPHRITWQATPSIPADRVEEVDFLIDGRLVWVEHQAPYIFGGDDNGANRGSLITTWLSPGPHVFVARVIDTAGRPASNTVNASVPPAPQPPPALRGVWTRVITARDIAKIAQDGGYSGSPPPGRWELAFDKIGAWELDAAGSGRASQMTVRGHTFTIYAPIQMAPIVNDNTTTSAYGHHGLGGQDCTPDGPFGTYRWSRSANRLNLAVVHDGCPNRAVIWDGVWTRVSPQIQANLKP